MHATNSTDYKSLQMLYKQYYKLQITSYKGSLQIVFTKAAFVAICKPFVGTNMCTYKNVTICKDWFVTGTLTNL